MNLCFSFYVFMFHVFMFSTLCIQPAIKVTILYSLCVLDSLILTSLLLIINDLVFYGFSVLLLLLDLFRMSLMVFFVEKKQPVSEASNAHCTWISQTNAANKRGEQTRIA